MRKRISLWRFGFTVLAVYDAAIEDVKAAQDKWEAGAIARIPEIDK